MITTGACTEEPPDTSSADGLDVRAADGSDSTTVGVDPSEAASVVEAFAGEPWFAGDVPDAPVAAEGEAIKVGHINQEDVPIGSYPEVRLGAEAAVEFINAELGGVDGRPIELVECIANFSVEGSQACAQEMVQAGVVAVTGGLDIMSGGSIPILEQNGIPYVGGIPVNFDEMQSPLSFQFSGGSPGAMTAFASDAIEQGQETVAVVYAEFAPVESAARYGIDLLNDAGVNVAEVSYPIVATDLLPVVSEAAQSDPDAILMFAADAACVRSMQTLRDLEVDADLYMVGSCAAPAILEEAGDAAEGTVFSIEGPFLDMDTGVVDGPLYAEAARRYGPDGYQAQSAGTVTFRSIMNLWVALNEIGAADLTPEAVASWFRERVDQPSFDGHPYTCDGTQVPGLPALCAPQQVLIRFEDGTMVQHSEGWIDVPEILSGSG
jgi:branched-chain amino acid transport system substrate-binding protein